MKLRSLTFRSAPGVLVSVVLAASISCSSPEQLIPLGSGGVSMVQASGGRVSVSGGAPTSGGQPTGDGGRMMSGGAGSGGEAAGGSGGASSGGAATGGGAAAGGSQMDGGSGGAEMVGTGGAAAFRSSGCDSAGPALAEGPHTFALDSLSRRYTVHLPSNYDVAAAWPLVLALHPNGGDLAYWDGTSGTRNIRGFLREKAVIVIAEAIGGNWRDYDLPEAQWPARVEQELRYFDRIVGDAKGQLCIDQRAIFAMGFSGGGSFSGVLGCRRPDIRAFAAGGSVIYFDPAACVGSSAPWIALSEDDLTDDRSAFLNYFVDRAGCDAANFREQGCHEYQNCDPTSPAVFCYYPGGHDWPSFGVEESWAFFSRFLEP